MLTQERLKKFEFERERDEYNQELKRLVAAEKQEEEHKKKEAKRKALETTKVMDEQVAQKKIQNQLKKQTDNLVHQIQHGDRKNEVDRESIRNYSQGRTS